MNEYTFENLIMNPETPDLERLIEKKVYYGTAPLDCLKRANKDYEVGILREIRKDCLCPFLVEVPNGMIFNYVCITPKKEEPKPNPKDVPFQDGREFFNYYLIAESRLEKEDYFLSNHGIWLKAKYADDALFMVIEIWSYGVVFSCDMKTTEELEGKYLTINEVTTWKELFRDYCFLDGSPCGKLMEVKDL